MGCIKRTHIQTGPKHPRHITLHTHTHTDRQHSKVLELDSSLITHFHLSVGRIVHFHKVPTFVSGLATSEQMMYTFYRTLNRCAQATGVQKNPIVVEAMVLSPWAGMHFCSAALFTISGERLEVPSRAISFQTTKPPTHPQAHIHKHSL